jgi:NADH dehydrogenase (ubiquinone) 1 alpha/beta subcomplex 1
MSFFRVAFRSPAASFTRNRISVSAAAVPRRTWLLQRAAFSAASGLTKEEITTRVLDVLKGFEKVDPKKVCNAKMRIVLQDA